MNIDVVNNQKLMERLEKMFFVFTLWFLITALFVVGTLFFDLVKVSAQASSRDPFIHTQWWPIGNSLLSGLAYAGFTFAISSVLRQLSGMKQRFKFNSHKLFQWTCFLFVLSTLFQFGWTLSIYLGSGFGPAVGSYSFLMKVYSYFSFLIPITFDLLLVVALYVFYFQFVRLKKFEEEVI